MELMFSNDELAAFLDEPGQQILDEPIPSPPLESNASVNSAQMYWSNVCAQGIDPLGLLQILRASDLIFRVAQGVNSENSENSLEFTRFLLMGMTEDLAAIGAANQAALYASQQPSPTVQSPEAQNG